MTAAANARKLLRQGRWWLLDYAYAARQQLGSLLQPRIPERYATGDPTLPAIILLPGVYENWRFLAPAASRLHALGLRIFTVPALGLNHLSVPESAAILATRLAELSRTHNVTHCIFVAHSKGGLTGKYLMLDALTPQGPALKHKPLRRYTLKHDAGTHLSVSSSGIEVLKVEVLGMVAVATPFSGSPYARHQLSRTLRDFSPTDATLMALQANVTVNHKIVSIYPDFDPHIPGGSALMGAENIQLPVSGHFRTLAAPTVLAAVEHAVVELAQRHGEVEDWPAREG